MKQMSVGRVVRCGLAVVAFCLATQGTVARAFDTFKAPTPEELAMKELPGYPGAAAVVLNREEIYNDDLHVIDHYNRIKVLTEEGKKYANVQLNYTVYTPDVSFDVGDDKKVGVIQGRTIHPDGTIIPFTGKPFRKVLEKGNTGSNATETEFTSKYMETVFTLPDVEVGSILEYRYKTLTNLDLYESPQWFIQGELYIKAAHYEWSPTLAGNLVDNKGRELSNMSWYPILPAGVKVLSKAYSIPGTNVVAHAYYVDVKDVPPIPDEEYQPPVKSTSYRVLFTYSIYKTGAEYWAGQGKDWSRQVDEFASTGGDVRAATEKAISGATTPDEKLRKIYAAIMAMENTRFTRARDAREDKAAGSAKVKEAADVLSLGRGSPEQLTELFIAMARAAGLKAYAMTVPDRSIEMFAPGWTSFYQFDDLIAIVNVDGKDVYLDPGSRYMPYGHLAWQHTYVGGLRQMGKGATTFAQTGGDQAKENRTVRAANLTMNEGGEVSGKIDIVYYGAEALAWRQTALKGDDESLKHDLRVALETVLPKSLEVKVGDVNGLSDYEQPLKVSFTVTGKPGTMTGKRLLLPADLFLTGATATFPHEKREQAVYFHYPQAVQDILRVNLPSGFATEGTPATVSLNLPEKEIYSLDVKADATGFTTRRTHLQAQVLVPVKDYDELRKFYGQFESKDQETIVLKAPAAGSGN
jgi:transglutaminase-like putative cysteine protease